jgi:carboxypeptidase C (cathepsin A)
MMLLTNIVRLLLFAITTDAQLPAEVSDLTTILGVNGTSVRFKENGLCETTPGVKSYSGYIDIAEDKHLFFWFFESRNQLSSDPITLFLNGGPGADSMGGVLNGRMPPDRMNELSL